MLSISGKNGSIYLKPVRSTTFTLRKGDLSTGRKETDQTEVDKGLHRKTET